MIRLYIKIILISVVILSICLGIVEMVAELQPLNPVLQGFVEACEGKPQPCWYGITPGVTTLAAWRQIQSEKLNQVIADLGANCKISISADTETVYGITMRGCNVTIGDLIQMLGTPQVFIYSCVGIFDYAFRDYISVASRPDWDMPFSEVSFSIQSFPSHLSSEGNVYQWMGFRPRRVYAKAQPAITCMGAG
ncbi:MAG: hypothetical protein ABI690_32745 [Chloroflexota bacterium]